MSPILTSILLIIIGLATIIGIYVQMNKTHKLKQNGVRVQGIIFEFSSSSNFWGPDNVNAPNVSDSVIRFVTKEGVWITKAYDSGIPYSWMKQVRKVEVIYDKNNPEDFVIISTTRKWLSYIFFLIGFGLLGTGVYFLIQAL